MNKSELLDFYKNQVKQYDQILDQIDHGAYKSVAEELEQCLTESVEACLQGIKKLEESNEQIN